MYTFLSRTANAWRAWRCLLSGLLLLDPMLLGRKVQVNWVTVLIPRLRWARISFSDIPRMRLRSSLLTASARQRSLNSQDGQWEFSIINGGEVDSACFLSLSRVCRAS